MLARPYDARDLDGMLACLDHDVAYHPLRLGGLTGVCRGHDGVRRWFAQLGSLHCHRIDLAELRDLSDGHVLAAGAVQIAGAGDVAPFCAMYHTTNGAILTARHYLSDLDLLERFEPTPTQRPIPSHTTAATLTPAERVVGG